MGTDYVSPKHRTHDRGVALESQWHLERSCPSKRILYRQRGAEGLPAALLRICASSPRLNTKRRLAGQVLAADRWRHRDLLEEQSLSHPEIHRRRRCSASTVDHP